MHSAEERTMPVVERFVSINGEGPRAGRLAAFIRFAGCNLACSWCDTAWANVGNCEHENLTPAKLVEWVAGSGAACVTLTGGEPTLQPGLPALIGALCQSEVWGLRGKLPRVVEVETNGAVDLAELAALRAELGSAAGLGVLDLDEACSGVAVADAVASTAMADAEAAAADSGSANAMAGAADSGSADASTGTATRKACDLPTQVCFTVDCKMPSSGMTAEMLPSNYSLLRRGDAVKFVVASCEDLECALGVIEKHDLCSRCEVFFSPVFSCIEPSQIVDFMQEHNLANVRLQLQLHKIIWPGQEKGV